MRRAVVLTVLAVVLGAGGPGRHAVAAPAVPRDVRISDFAYAPETIVVQVGETVQWTNVTGGTKHTITADGGAFDSNEVRAGGIDGGLSFSHVFTQTGRYPYHCMLHTSSHPGMKGIVVVEPASTSAEQAAPHAGGAGTDEGHGTGKLPVAPIVGAVVVFVLLVAGAFVAGWRPSRRGRGG